MRKPRNRIMHHGPGKGSADRTTDTAAYVANLEAVKDLGKVPARKDPSFTVRGGKAIKVYGAPPKPTVFAKLTGRIILH